MLSENERTTLLPLTFVFTRVLLLFSTFYLPITSFDLDQLSFYAYEKKSRLLHRGYDTPRQ